MKIYCSGCQKFVKARETTGEEIYPHRIDLYELKMIKCDDCGNYKAFDGGKIPHLIPTPELRKARLEIHDILDPLWKSGRIKRKEAYKYISKRIGWNFHNESLRDMEEAKEALRIVKELQESLFKGGE